MFSVALSPEIHRRIPTGLATNETWMLKGRKRVPGAKPAAYFRPDDFAPEPFGSPHGIPLYRKDQTKDYHPRPETVAARRYYDYFVADQNRHKYGLWDDGRRRTGPDEEPDWRNWDRYLSRSKIRDHLRGKEMYGCWGNLVTRWFAIDLDYHGGDPGLFLEILRILKDLAAFLPRVRWFYVLSRSGVTGLHLIGLLPEPRLLEEVRREVRQVLSYLEDEHINELLRYKPANVKDEDFHPIANLELYPATNHNFRLPYAADRITVTDDWLNKAGEVSLKPNLIRFMDYVENPERQAVPLAEVIAYIQAHVKPQAAKQARSSRTGKKRKRRGGGNGMGKIEPLKGRHLEFITGVVRGTETMPADTIGCWAAPALRHLMLVDGLSADEALEKIEEFYGMIPDPSFSDRLSSGDIQELLRTDAYTVAKIEERNGYQPRPENSAAIFAKVKNYCNRLGFVFADPTTWDALNQRKTFPFDLRDVDFSLTFEEKLAVKETGAAILKCDIPSVYQAAHRIKAFVTKYPGKELPASLVPHLCAGLPICWKIPSDENRRCKKAEKFLALLCKLGIIKIIHHKRWFGDGSPGNRAVTYGLPKDEGSVRDRARRWLEAQAAGKSFYSSPDGEGGGGGIYLRDFSPFTQEDVEEFVLELERLNRPWKPQYHSSG
jgi:hypothetical protein